MARPVKVGCDYLPLDVDIFSDDKLKFVAARFGEKGELITIKLLCKIYREGYFIKWGEDESILFADSAGKNVTHGLVNDVVNELLKRDFFDEDMRRRFNILTSRGIQRRYHRIKKDAGSTCEIYPDYLLFELTGKKPPVSGQETPDNDPDNPSKKRTGKNSKENNSPSAFTPDLFSEPVFVVSADIPLPAMCLEAAEYNQFTYTGERNTEFICEQWKVFLLERMNDPKFYKNLTDLTSYFLNWIRNKKPERKADNNPKKMVW